MDMENIRSQYPNPTSANNGNTSDRPCEYCVGGAFMMVKYQLTLESVATSSQVRFPTADQLAEEFVQLNPTLTTALAYAFADELTTYNDDEEFEAAWDCLDDALTYTP